VVVTSRPGDRLDRLGAALFGVPHEVFDLGPLGLPEMAAVLRAARPGLSDAEVERIADVSQGNPLYLRAVTEELAKGPGYDLRDLPAGIDGFFRRATAGLRDSPGGLLRDVLGLLAAARKPLSLRELAEVTGQRQRPVHEQGVGPVRQFLLELDGSYTFYHARFHEFVTRELLYEDELADYHRLLAGWLQRPHSRAYDYRWTSLAYHLGAAGDRDGLLAAVDRTFLAEKVRRCGYAVLEDVELLGRALLEAGDPALVERCVALVEGLRAVVGGDVIEDARRAVRGYRAGPASFRSRVVAPPVPAVPGLDVYVGMLPKVEVGADFFEVIPLGQRLVVAVGDAPGAGLKSAFVARFIGNVFRRLVEQASPLHLGDVFGELNRILSGHAYFEVVSLQGVVVDPREGELAIASAGHPYPVVYSARRGKCDRLPVRGDLLNAPAPGDAGPVRYEQRRAEIGPGDVLVLLTDGLTEDNRLRGDRYGYRFTRLVEEKATRGAKAIGEAILDDWRAYPRGADDADDVTVLVVAVQAPTTPA
jgi:stage II sporulation SpoE-like protein